MHDEEYPNIFTSIGVRMSNYVRREFSMNAGIVRKVNPSVGKISLKE